MTEPDELEKDPILQSLRAWDTRSVADVLRFRDELTVVVPSERLVATCEYLRDEPALTFDYLSDISVVDRFPMERRFELNYHLMSIGKRQIVRLRVRMADDENPEIESVVPVWPTASWHEREIFDLFGIRFAGHPDLRRIVMPDDWEGFPLRRDYPTEGYR